MKKSILIVLSFIVIYSNFGIALDNSPISIISLKEPNFLDKLMIFMGFTEPIYTQSGIRIENLPEEISPQEIIAMGIKQGDSILYTGYTDRSGKLNEKVGLCANINFEEDSDNTCSSFDKVIYSVHWQKPRESNYATYRNFIYGSFAIDGKRSTFDRLCYETTLNQVGIYKYTKIWALASCEKRREMGNGEALQGSKEGDYKITVQEVGKICEKKWICATSKTSRYLLTDCSWNSEQFCSTGCDSTTGKCNPMDEEQKEELVCQSNCKTESDCYIPFCQSCAQNSICIIMNPIDDPITNETILQTENFCRNAEDDDLDNLIDCHDPDCLGLDIEFCDENLNNEHISLGKISREQPKGKEDSTSVMLKYRSEIIVSSALLFIIIILILIKKGRKSNIPFYSYYNPVNLIKSRKLKNAKNRR